jgi:putative ABC transport system permease protein
MRIYRWLIYLLGWTIPRRIRTRWRKEWQAEIEYREALHTRWDRHDRESQVELARRLTGALWDVFLLQPQRREDEMFQDLRYGLRMMLKHKGFMAVAVLTLALGIGANTAMFSVLNTYLFNSLPYPESDRLVRVFRTSPHSQSWPHSAANFLDFRKKNDVFQQMIAYSYDNPNLVEEGQSSERLTAMIATSDLFPGMGVQAALGRVFGPEEDQPNASRVAVLSDRFWQKRFGGDPGVIGRKMTLDGQPVEIIGVMPPSFEHPLLWGNIDLWRPIAFSAQQQANRGNNYLRAFARLKPGVTIEQAQSAMVTLAANMSREYSSNQGESLRLELLKRSTSDDIGRSVMWFTFGLAIVVLLIACANLANLQLVRVSSRAREFAVRAALGAGRSRLMRQSLTESLTIAMIGGALSLLIALGGVRYISGRLFSDLPGAQVSLDYKVFGFALLVSAVTGLLFGLIPAWMGSRPDVNQALRENTRSATGGRSQRILRNALIVGEVAFALILLAGAGLFLGGVRRFLHQDPGWRVDGLLTAQLGLQGEQYRTPAARLTYYQQLEERLRALPGVENVALSRSHPAWGFNSSGSFLVEGQPEPPPEKMPESFFEAVSPGYFETLGARLIAGRAFTPEDKTDRPQVVIINQTMARRFWPNESAVGKRIGSRGDNKNWREIVGVVDELKIPSGLTEIYTHFQTFSPLAQTTPGGVNISLRTSVAPETVSGAFRKTVAEIDPTQPLNRIRTARATIDQSMGSVTLLGSLLAAFALLGLTLASIGVYGVTSYSVAQRTGEIGIRMALGAQNRDVLWLVLSKSGGLTLAGAAIGVVGAYGVARLLAWAIPTLPTRDPVTFIGLTITLVVIALVACFLPARRATKVDPMIALRQE